MVDKNAQKLFEARKCPVCGCNLMPPSEAVKMEGDKVCGHCGCEVAWVKEWICVEKEYTH